MARILSPRAPVSLSRKPSTIALQRRSPWFAMHRQRRAADDERAWPTTSRWPLARDGLHPIVDVVSGSFLPPPTPAGARAPEKTLVGPRIFRVDGGDCG